MTNDLISREEILKAFSDYVGSGMSMNDFDALWDIIEKMPPVKEPKIGHWIRWYEQKDFGLYIGHIPHCRCSECGKEYDPHSSQFIKFCSECGAKMVESESEDKE